MLKLRMTSPDKLVARGGGFVLVHEDTETKQEVLDSVGLASHHATDYDSLIVLVKGDRSVAEVWATPPYNPGTCYMIYPRSEMYEVVQ